MKTAAEHAPVHNRFDPELDLQAVDGLLISHFADLVGELSLQKLLHAASDEPVTEDLDAYELVPLVPTQNNGGTPKNSLQSARYYASPPSHIRFPKKGCYEEWPIHMDAWMALALAHNGIIRALCGAGLDSDSRRLFIKQIQGGHKLPEGSEEAKLHTGLWSGFLWRDTLVQGWFEIADLFGQIEGVEIQSGLNNPWLRKQPSKDFAWRLLQGYDVVADRMNFKQQSDNNWITPVRPTTRHSLCDTN